MLLVWRTTELNRRVHIRAGAVRPFFERCLLRNCPECVSIECDQVGTGRRMVTHTVTNQMPLEADLAEMVMKVKRR